MLSLPQYASSIGNLSILAHAFPAICLIGICLAKCEENLTIALLTIGVMFQGALYTGFFVNPLDIASNYAGILLYP